MNAAHASIDLAVELTAAVNVAVPFPEDTITHVEPFGALDIPQATWHRLTPFLHASDLGACPRGPLIKSPPSTGSILLLPTRSEYSLGSTGKDHDQGRFAPQCP